MKKPFVHMRAIKQRTKHSSHSNLENAINEKDKNIASQNETIKKYSASECTSHVRLKKNNDDIFRMKPKKKGRTKSLDVDALKC